MTAIAEELITHLKAQSSITALVGSGTAARILQQTGLKESSTLPAIVIQQMDEVYVEHAGGRSTLASAAFTVTACAATSTGRNTLAGLIRDALTPSGGTYGSTKVTEVVLVNSGMDGDDLPSDSSDQRIYWKAAAYKLWYYAS